MNDRRRKLIIKDGYLESKIEGITYRCRKNKLGVKETDKALFEGMKKLRDEIIKLQE